MTLILMSSSYLFHISTRSCFTLQGIKPPHRLCQLQGWQCSSAIWGSKKNWNKIRSGQYGMIALGTTGVSLEITDQDISLLKIWYSEKRGLPGNFEDIKFTEHNGKRVQADVIVRIAEGPPLKADTIEEAVHGTSMYNLGAILVNGPFIGWNAASHNGQKRYGFYCFSTSLGRFDKAWSYATFVSLFRNGTLVTVLVLLRVDLSVQHNGYKSSHDQWCMHNLAGVHIVGLHFRLIKQGIFNMHPMPLFVKIEQEWDPALEYPFKIPVPAGSLRKC